MSGGHAVAKLYFNCGQCGAALSDRAFTCERTLSMEEDCQRLLCDTCARYHENYYKHDVFRARNLDNIISTGTFVCTFEGCVQDIPAPQYSQHQRMCPYRRLACPICNEGFASISLRSHLLRQHQFNHYQLNYGYLNTGHNISNDRGCVFSGREEDFVFFIAGASLYFVWLDASAAASSQASASSSVPAPKSIPAQP
ncbi:hypothetical protein PVAP13_7NG084000 [Panicum virgatum]|uniref:Uncharacterized protein n=1 Tax=Panicum virgatum TaxID=38727 RepID=A0A8T0PS67_PANVG|nr:hypothetical protein PVAP13_7NG084000 [Panicum virgatum]